MAPNVFIEGGLTELGEIVRDYVWNWMFTFQKVQTSKRA